MSRYLLNVCSNNNNNNDDDNDNDDNPKYNNSWSVQAS